MRLFGGDRITNMMDSLKIDENMPIENRILTSTIENAQSKIEGRNFGIRKNVLQFDDVMNKQREIIYAQRNKVLDGENLKDSILSMMDETVDSAMQMYMPEGVEPEHWNMEGFRNYFIGMIAGDVLEISGDDLKKVNKKSWATKLRKKSMHCMQNVRKIWAKASPVSWNVLFCSKRLIPSGWITSTQWMSSRKVSLCAPTDRRTQLLSTVSKALTCSTR